MFLDTTFLRLKRIRNIFLVINTKFIILTLVHMELATLRSEKTPSIYRFLSNTCSHPVEMFFRTTYMTTLWYHNRRIWVMDWLA